MGTVPQIAIALVSIWAFGGMAVYIAAQDQPSTKLHATGAAILWPAFALGAVATGVLVAGARLGVCQRKSLEMIEDLARRHVASIMHIKSRPRPLLCASEEQARAIALEMVRMFSARAEAIEETICASSSGDGHVHEQKRWTIQWPEHHADDAIFAFGAGWVQGEYEMLFGQRSSQREALPRSLGVALQEASVRRG